MKKFLITILGFALLPMLFACKSETEKQKDDVKEESAGEAPTDAFKLLAIVKNVGERIEVEVIESDYAFGEYWVLSAENIVYADKNGTEISRSDLKPNMKIEITYGGQVMMSYPPQIVASKIQIIQ